MKKHLAIFGLALALFATSCSKNDDTDVIEPPVSTGSVVEVSGDIKVNTTWSADKIYLLKGFVYITDGATLTIAPGTIIKGDKATKATLVVTRGSKLNAEGTAAKPIVFTSNVAAGGRREGDWGGLILLGKAPTNQGSEVKIEGGLTPTVSGQEQKYIQYGGTETADNSGILKYVRVEYAGIPFSVDNEINGITFGGVGSGTTIEYVQVYRSGDDAYEWFGGTVNAKHIIASGTWDDDFDTDFGYSGKIQFAVAQRFPLVADQSGSNGFESDNNATGTTAPPKTSAIFSNVTVVGPLAAANTKINGFFQHAAQIRRNSAISTFNSIFTGFPDGIYIDDSTGALTSSNVTDGSLAFQNNLIYGITGTEVKATNATSLAIFETVIKSNNTFLKTAFANALLTAPYKYSSDIVAATVGGAANPQLGRPDFTVVAGGVAASGAAFTHAKIATDTFFEKVTYRGAFGTTDWTAGWANFDPQVTPYTTPGAVN
ncbi:hypothetical protein [Pedobacter duraquae]|uniref:T9SS C-terminal target domain-containing protein n=1 Tax=Pedobacter duraquae TaxID=425511 RepID=A0A4R6IIY5_9SPHI|nr:hypothetical protein [Pedobacter duraquae]TDO21959.1 hypothetical protein CLV32_3068 [Pedobacter duraquae]